MKRRFLACRRVICCAIIAILSNGCATALRLQSHDRATAAQMTGVYPATKCDAVVLAIGCTDLMNLDGPVPVSQQILLRPILVVGGIIDLPISIVCDTLLLPYDLTKHKKQDVAQPTPAGDVLKAAPEE